MHSASQALGQSHPAYASTDLAEYEGGKPVHIESIIKMSTYNFLCVASISWVKQSEASTMCDAFILWTGVSTILAETSLEAKAKSSAFYLL